MNDNNPSDASKLMVSSEEASKMIVTGPVSFSITLSEDIIRLLTKQADLEANNISVRLQNLQNNVSSTSMSSFTTLESYLGYNFPSMPPPRLSMPSISVEESFYDLIAGQSFGSILVKGKILNTMISVGSGTYNVDYEGSVESTFKKHFIYTKDNFARKEDLSSSRLNFFRSEESEGIVNFSKIDEVLNDNTGLFWWDNASVDISYKTSDRTVTLKFVNGRQVDINSSYLNQAPEIDYNLNLMIARYIESNYKFTGLVDNPRIEHPSVIERNFKDDATVIHEETKKEFSELILPFVKTARKIHITDSEKELILVGSEDDKIVYMSFGSIYFKKYKVRIRIEPSCYHSTFGYHEKDVEIDFNKFKQGLGDSISITVRDTSDNKITYSNMLGSFIVKPDDNEESFNSVEIQKDDLNSNFFLSNYILRCILDEYKEDILKSVSEFLK